MKRKFGFTKHKIIKKENFGYNKRVKEVEHFSNLGDFVSELFVETSMYL